MSGYVEDPWPRTWADMSFDCRLFFAFHMTMVLLLIGSSLVMASAGKDQSLLLEAGIAAAFLATAILLSVHNRRLRRWHWTGAGPAQFLKAALAVAVAAILLLAASPMIDFADPRVLPWVFGLLGICLFNLLTSLRLVRASETRFAADCTRSQEIAPQQPSEPTWKRVVRWVHSAVVVLVWLEMMTFFYVYGIRIRAGSLAPTSEHTVAINDHGTYVYLSSSDAALVNTLEAIGFAGIAGVILSALFLQSVLGVRLTGLPPPKARSSSRR